jgi:1-acyl-sn-glycerol-3-phosphate acyltransferase
VSSRSYAVSHGVVAPLSKVLWRPTITGTENVPLEGGVLLASNHLREGRAFGIYPEGTRSRDGRLYKGRTGVAWLALTAGVPIVPVGLIGTDKVQPIGGHFPRLAKVHVSFGQPVSPQAYAGMPSGRARRLLTDEVMDAIAALSGQERVDAYNELPPGSSGVAVGI